MRQSPEHYVPQVSFDQRPAVLWTALVIATLMFVSTILIAPLAGEHSVLSQTIYQAFSHLCHQRPERSFFIAGHKFAVCARCTGIYTGFAFGLVLYPLVKSLRSTETPERKWLFLAALPLAVDVSLTLLHVWRNTHASRFFTGALLGGVTVFYIVPGLVELVSRTRRKRSFINLADIPSISAERVAAAPSDYSAPDRRI